LIPQVTSPGDLVQSTKASKENDMAESSYQILRETQAPEKPSIGASDKDKQFQVAE